MLANNPPMEQTQKPKLRLQPKPSTEQKSMNKIKSSRVTIKTRQALVEAVKAYNQATGTSFKTVMAAVLYAGERLKGRVTTKAALALINDETVSNYNGELLRRAMAYDAQVAGMVRNALPKEIRTSENIAIIVSSIPLGQSIPQIKALIATAVGSPASEEI